MSAILGARTGVADDRVNILLVDDQPSKLLTYEAILAELGENLIKANSAREALDHLLRNEIAVILVDVCMPELDGFDLAAMIREHPRYRNTAILLVSAVLMADPDRLRGYDSGALDYVTVPIIPEVLRAKVKVFVDLYRKGRALERLNRELEARVAERTHELEARNEQLRDSEERYRLASEAVQGGISDLDLASGEVRRTDGVLAILGFEPHEVSSSRDWWAGRVDPDDLPRYQAIVTDALEQGASTYRVEYRARHRDEHWVWVCEQGRVVRGADGRPLRAVRHLTDISMQRAAEEMLRDAHRRKDQFLATLAHELRNPLAPMRNVVEMLERPDVSPEDFEWSVGVLSRQIDHLTRLVEDLLDVSRISRDRLTLRREQVDIREIVLQAAEVTRSVLERKRLELEVTLPSRPAHVDGDRVRLTQVITNLLTNAAKFTAPGGTVRLAADIEPAGRKGREAVIRVTDNGIGIPADQMAQVFEMFYQGPAAQDGTQAGLGVGLTLVKRLVELHEGSVEARSDGFGHGSEFTVRLPMIRKAAGPEVPLVTGREAGAVTPAFSCLKVLIADDNRDAVESLALLLRRRGSVVEVVHDGLAAIEAARRFRPDVALLDIGMPHMTGYEAARKIRELDAGREVKLVAITGWGREEDHRSAREAGFDFHLVKPVDLDMLFRILGEARSARAVRTGGNGA